MEGEAKFADVILPACTNFERWDIGEWSSGQRLRHPQLPDVQPPHHRSAAPGHQAAGRVQVGLQDLSGIAARLGLEGMYTMGRDELDWVKATFDATDLPTVTTWEDFEKKGYYVVPPRPADRKPTPGMRWFAEDRERDTPDWGPAPWEVVQNKGLQTQSGKVEFVSNSLKRAEATVLSIPSVQSWDRSTSPAGKVTAPPNCSASTRCS